MHYKSIHSLYLAKRSAGFDERKATEELYGIQGWEVSEARASFGLFLEASSPTHSQGPQGPKVEVQGQARSQCTPSTEGLTPAGPILELIS